MKLTRGAIVMRCVYTFTVFLVIVIMFLVNHISPEGISSQGKMVLGIMFLAAMSVMWLVYFITSSWRVPEKKQAERQ